MVRNLACAIAILSISVAASAADKSKPQASDNYDELYARYLDAARTTGGAAGQAASPVAWMAGLALDPRARNVNDLVTIQVSESVTASGSADSALSKDNKGSASVTKLFGAEGKLPSWLDPTSLVAGASSTSFKGGGTTNRSGALTARITARVVEVLPNGDLVLEGAREIDINGDRQILVLSGVVRPNDVDRNNVVQSTQIGQFRIRYFGRGLIKDNLRPSWLIILLNKIF